MDPITPLVASVPALVYDALGPALSLAITASGLNQLDDLAGALRRPLQFDIAQWVVQQLNSVGVVPLAFAFLVVAQLAFLLGRRAARKQQKVYILDFGVHKPDSRFVALL